MMRKKKWTVERFSKDVLPLLHEQFGEHAKLPLRESVILTTAMIDAGLVEILSKRLTGPEHEIVEFLGADEDGRAPCGSFGSRIQLARLLGILVDEDVKLLRLLKKLRNKAAHRVKLEVTDTEIGNILCDIFALLKTPILTLTVLIVKLAQGDANAIKRVEGLLDWPRTKEMLGEFVPQVREWNKWNMEWLLSHNATVSDKTTVYSTFVVMFPTLLRREAKMASVLLTFLLILYNGRLGLFVSATAPVTQIALPSDTIRIWDSDLISPL